METKFSFFFVSEEIFGTAYDAASRFGIQGSGGSQSHRARAKTDLSRAALFVIERQFFDNLGYLSKLMTGF